MSEAWLITYDIADPKRLARIGRIMRRVAVYLQHSVYLFEGPARDLDRLWSELEACIDPHRDDIRAYHLTEHVQIWRFGRQGLPEGVTLSGSGSVRGLLAPVSLGKIPEDWEDLELAE
ncbi:MAG: CRISPR-associated endonuclease Cas2 [Casimicrobiaceae bacterium]|nr:CRISPR-associated endonuclease Cas2 [Casimicrobiaceae bacterium]MDW8313265.1 CRISPR-associated endonuclease Cas2 [Burkholderiales bacterium]